MKVFILIPIEKELPDTGQDVYTYNDKDDWQSQCYICSDDGKWYNTWTHDDCECFPTHWLKATDIPSEFEIRKTISKDIKLDVGQGTKRLVKHSQNTFLDGVNYILSLLSPNTK